MRFVFPAMVVLWVAGMGMAGVGKISLAGTPFITATIVLWLVALVVSWFLIRPALSEPDESAKSKLAMGVGITHLILVVAMYLMIFKPGGYSFNT
jgi:hydrogenase-4 membrane subunit HyfE